MFALAALGGVFLAIRHLRGQSLPGAVAIVHGAAAAIALVLLLIAVLTSNLSGLATVALVLFVVAALGGFYLASLHLRGERHPTPLILGHGLIAVVAFVALLAAIV
jgi:multisubunit Na+/H+ antiporter MnhF subunit